MSLPTTRLIGRRPRRGRWSLAIAVALALNAGLIGLLARSAPAHESAPPALPAPARLVLADLPASAPPAAAPASTRPVGPPAAVVPPAMPMLPLPALPEVAIAAPSLDGWLPAMPAAIPTPIPAGAGAGAGQSPAAVAPSGPAAPPPAPGGTDAAPTLLAAVDLERHYPLRASRRGQTAEVTLQIELDEHGVVTTARVTANTGSQDFVEASLRAIREVRWAPALRDGKPTATSFAYTIIWKLR